jgi:hypothetical protein
MAAKTRGDGKGNSIRVSASCIADVVTAGPTASLIALLRPYKDRKKGKGFMRSVYYKPTLSAVRNYHARNRDPLVFREAILELEKKAEVSEKRSLQTQFRRNIQAIQAYERLYKNRNFVIQSNHRLSYKIGPITLTAEPDLWVTENGVPVLLKIGLASKKRGFIDVMLTVIRKAAVSSGYKVRAKNIVYLNIRTGEEMTCRGSLKRFNLDFSSAARQIARVWPVVKPDDTQQSPGGTVQPSV